MGAEDNVIRSGDLPDSERSDALSRRSLLGGAGVVMGAALLNACGGNDASTTSGSSPKITVKDQRGKTLVFDRPVTRIVTLPIPAAAMVIAIDQTADHLVGIQEESWTAIRDSVMATMFPAALKIPHNVANAEFAPNVEGILGLNPDLVVQWGDHGSEIIKPLENAGLNVLGLSYGTQDDLAAWITLFATVLGKPARGRAMLAGINAELRRARSAAAGQTSPRPKIVYFLQFTGGLEVAGSSTYNDYYIKMVGATNPASGTNAVQGFAGVDVEQVLAWDPDIVLLGNFDDAVPDDIYGDDVWQGMAAVQSRRVYKVPLGGYRWDPPGQESPLMWRWLSDIAFPTSAASDLPSRLVSTYRFLYGYSPTRSQVDSILRTAINSSSANYRQFNAA